MAFLVENKDLLKSRNNRAVSWTLKIIGGVSLIVFFSAQSRAAVLALCGSMILLFSKTEYVRIRVIVFLKRYFLLIAIAAVVLVSGAYMFKKTSADSRFFINKISVLTMKSNNWKGVGPGRFGGEYGKTQAEYFKNQIAENGKEDLDWSVIDSHDRLIADIPINAFNEYLNIGIEFGLLAMLSFIGIIVTGIMVSYKRNTLWCYGLMALAIFALFSYPLHIISFQVLTAMMLAACISDRYPIKQIINNQLAVSGTNKLSVAPWALLSVLVLLSVSVTGKVSDIKQYHNALRKWKEMEHWHVLKHYDFVVEDSPSIYPYLQDEQLFLFEYGQSLNKTGYYSKSDSVLEQGVQFSCDPIYWNIMGDNCLAVDDYVKAEEFYKHAFYMVPNRIYPLYKLAKLYEMKGDTLSFLSMAEKVDGFIPKQESAKTEEYRSEIRNIKYLYLK